MPNKEQILNKQNLPRHIAIIMDGNGRWAKKRLLPRTAGHVQGAKVFMDTIDDCRDLGIEAVTFYAFSTENWKRPEQEVNNIIGLLRQYVKKIQKMARKNTRVIIIGDLTLFPQDIIDELRKVERETKDNTGLTVSVALNYGGRAEILNAVKLIAEQVKQGQDFSKITESEFSDYLYTAGLPEVDLVVRPSGEKRLSNYLIWQSAYAELVFMDVLWPDFNKKHLIKALEEYASRNRRFGGINDEK